MLLPEPDEDASADAVRIEPAPIELSPAERRALWLEVGVVLVISVGNYLATSLWSLWAAGGVESFDAAADALAFPADVFFMVQQSIVTIVPVAYLMWRSGEPWSQWGLVRPSWLDAPAALFLLMVLPLVDLALDRGLMRLGIDVPEPEFHFTLPSTPAEWGWLVVLCLAGALNEEWVLRGYLIPRLERLCGSTGRALVASSALFASYHIYQGWDALLYVFGFGLVLGGYFCFFRRLWPMVAAHAAYNYLNYVGWSDQL